MSCSYKKRLKTLVTSLQKSVECPVCLETLKPPFKVCVRGHGVCGECMLKLNKCPLCQSSFILENLVCVKNVLEALPNLCCYSDAGCDEVVELGNDHERFCGYRPIICRNQRCSVKMPLVQYLDHYKTHNPSRSMKSLSDMNGSKKGTWNLKPEFGACGYLPVYFLQNLFWILLVNDVTEKQFKVLFQATPIGKLEHDYYACMKFKNSMNEERFVYTYTIKAQVLISCDQKFEWEEFGNFKILDNEYCMRIPLKELANFINDDGVLCYSYSIFRV